MSLVSDLLPVFNELLGLLDEAGLCPYQVFVRRVTWTGSYIGDGTKTQTDVD